METVNIDQLYSYVKKNWTQIDDDIIWECKYYCPPFLKNRIFFKKDKAHAHITVYDGELGFPVNLYKESPDSLSKLESSKVYAYLFYCEVLCSYNQVVTANELKFSENNLVLHQIGDLINRIKGGEIPRFEGGRELAGKVILYDKIIA